MSLQAKVGTFAANTITGDQPITGLGFTPKAVILWGGNLTADGNGAGGMTFRSFCASSTQRECVAIACDDASPSNTGFSFQQKAIVLLSDGTPTTDATADFVTMDSGGFTINWSDAPASAVKINYLALGGSDITNVEVGTLASGTGTGAVSKTGMTFKPDVCLFIAKAATANTQAHGTGTIASLAVGGFTNFGGTIQQGAWNLSVNDGGTTGQTRIYERTDQCIATEVAGNKKLEATGTSFNSDGFTITTTTNAQTNQLLPYLAIKGGKWKMGNDLTPTVTGNAGKTGIGFAPVFLLAFGHFASASSSVVIGSCNSGFGAATSAAAARATGLGISSQGVTAKNVSADARVISTIGSALGVTVNADLVTLDADGWTLHYNNVQGSAREFLWLTGASSGPVTQELDVTETTVPTLKKTVIKNLF